MADAGEVARFQRTDEGDGAAQRMWAGGECLGDKRLCKLMEIRSDLAERERESRKTMWNGRRLHGMSTEEQKNEGSRAGHAAMSSCTMDAARQHTFGHATIIHTYLQPS